MTKKELEKKIGEIASRVEDLIVGINECEDEARKVLTLIEYLPEAVDIEDDVEDE